MSPLKLAANRNGNRPESPLPALVTRRSRRYLRTSLILMTLTLVFSGAVLLYVERAHQQQSLAFDDNTNLKLITVTHKESDGAGFENLTSADRSIIGEVLAAADTAGTTPEVVVANRYEFGVGIDAADGQSYSIFGIDSEFAPTLGVAELQPGVGYTLAPTWEGQGPNDVTLLVPVVSVADNGYSSAAAIEHTLVLDDSLERSKVEYLFGGRLDDVMFVDSATFADLAESMFAADWETVRTRWENGELPMTPLVGATYVAVDEIDAVRSTATTLEENGYGTFYSLRAFDEIERSLQRTTFIGLLFGIGALAAVSAYVVLSWRSYLALSRRDIGILKHWGLPDDLIVATYADRLNSSLFTAALITAGGFALAAPALMGLVDGTKWALFNIGSLAIVLLALRQIIVQTVVRPQVQLGVLSLLKQHREFQ